jgi:hypothetical protein
VRLLQPRLNVREKREGLRLRRSEIAELSLVETPAPLHHLICTLRSCLYRYTAALREGFMAKGSVWRASEPEGWFDEGAKKGSIVCPERASAA